MPGPPRKDAPVFSMDELIDQRLSPPLPRPAGDGSDPERESPPAEPADPELEPAGPGY